MIGFGRRVIPAFGSLLAISVVPAFARAAGEDGGAQPAGMPQFDPTWFPSQLFWLAVSFVLLYLLMSLLALPRIAKVQASRRAQRDADMAAAHKARDEAAAMIALHDKSNADARARAQALLADAEKETSALIAKGTAELASILIDRMSQADRRIANARAKVMSSMPQITGDIAVSIINRVAGIPVDQGAAEEVARRLGSEKLSNARKG